MTKDDVAKRGERMEKLGACQLPLSPLKAMCSHESSSVDKADEAPFQRAEPI